MKFQIFSLGCKVNIYESEAVSYDLIQKGFIQTDKEPDVVIINTCTVTSQSDAKSRKLIRSKKEENPNAIIVVMGCYSQLDPTTITERIGADIVIGTNNRKKIYDLILEFINKKEQINLVEDSKNYKEFEELCLNKLSLHTRGFIKIQDGCENFCSYCAIPYSRGPIKSRNPESVINEVKQLVTSGVKEIILSGINTGTYGKDLGNITLAQLIDRIINEVPTLYRLRLSSIELMEITDELLDVLERNKNKIANHLHIPLQSGSDGVLKRMERKYLMKEYFEKIDIIKKRFPDIAITTDCLAGFVGETEEEFEETCQSFKKIGFAESHIFPYSIRPNTKAYNMPNHLKPETIKLRAKTLQTLAKKLSTEYKEKFIGKKMDVLFEQNKKGYWYGHTTNYLEVKVKDENNDLTNKVLKIELISIEQDTILGKEVK